MILLLTIVHGDYHVNLFKNTCLKSLSMKKNKEALSKNNSIWNVYTDKKHIESVTTWINEALPAVKANVIDISQARRYIDASQSAFVTTAEEALKNNAKILFAPPDIFFGDGSVNGLLKSAKDKDSVAVAAHIRVLPSMCFDQSFISQENVTNAELVYFGWKHLHRCWVDAEFGHPRQNQYGTGVCWQKIEDGIYSVVHRLPTPYMINLTEEDLQYFKLQAGFGHFDHRWPGDILLHRGRQRYVTSSDVAFMVEITEPHKNISSKPDGDPNDFWAHHFHNEVNKQILVTLRANNPERIKATESLVKP